MGARIEGRPATARVFTRIIAKVIFSFDIMENATTKETATVSRAVAVMQLLYGVGRLAPDQFAAKGQVYHRMAVQVGKTPYRRLLGLRNGIQKLEVIDVDMACFGYVDDLDTCSQWHIDGFACAQEGGDIPAFLAHNLTVMAGSALYYPKAIVSNTF